MPIGIGFTPFEDRLDVIERVTRHAEERGLAFVSVAEAMSLAAPLVLARLAAVTSRIGLTTGVLSVWGRTPATLAMTAAELQRQSDGRFVLGLGAGTAPIAEGFHGNRWESPLGRLRSTCLAVSALLRGERLPDPPSHARPLALAKPPDTKVPLALAAITDPSIRLAGELADQWLPFLLPPSALDRGGEQLRASAVRHERSTVPTVTAAIPVAIAEDEATASTIAARWLVTYCTRMGPVYPRVLRENGYGSEIDALLEASSDPRTPVLPAAAERLARDVLVFGAHGDMREVLARWQQHADQITLVVPFASQLDDLLVLVDHAVTPRPPTRRGGLCG
ncbi:LLM class flavin-dependent oxidoreductase [Longivirga aurantiaca]|uniref:LLM class flavin-dependent oxidoreductase n=1 Tax=Longivirga aurantiaca TaxID=1837743 RepID=A0ABW1T2R7_9ACTN